MKKSIKTILAILAVFFIFALISVPAFAAEATPADAAETAASAESEAGNNTTKTKAIVAGAIIGLVATAGAVTMCVVIKSASDNIARQPEAAGNIRSTFMLGLVFIETAIIYALIIAILVIFVL